MIDPDTLAWDKMGGLIPVIVQDRSDGAVRMVGYVNRDALAATIDSGFVTFFSRSKQRLWTKGEISGNRLRLVAARADCDGDALLLTVDAEGPTCHLGTPSCFGDIEANPHFLDALADRVRDRASADPSDSYTARLLSQGVKRIAQKVGEEGVETALAATAGDRDELISEAADLIYHLTVLLQAKDIGWDSVAAELEQRK
ncbi:bifunctional phosphoribosyl-AMP cyclohydrolase/phosphoribosyl-ATP diphosphatase HisIE [Sphingomonas jaspsi]|uniref:bifunctional phosphoribosyl-AMP cyclohydrolase/phosphoribosyl-ATP diphosphatase HisIE n=1 Tax=Sphingomonas jaspsi TaxID=392409 RepID=UPI0004B38353|nr:bifunctional phosphoribosyl-AMP cyclohydrolase/phosphoribosyl-ATP diphosphatase HisIE [Sphingomonas jaspsi]